MTGLEDANASDSVAASIATATSSRCAKTILSHDWTIHWFIVSDPSVKSQISPSAHPSSSVHPEHVAR